ncbi:hypothetical protein HPB52_006615 [Rhipicephalus sanguineus]|uniref:Uncharacterized protein n=1 Tax=Rhipicephalus sanguineus TaxID=34632 RepID=A0A9D4T724_RHISA|nr:hypothetical protein HPB52_006615 [Rhipicephalus sanguineus]
MRTLNPFVFIVQIVQRFTGLLCSVNDANAILATDTWTAQAFNAPTLHVPDILPFVAVESGLRHYEGTMVLALHATPPQIPATTKAHAPSNAGCGHGSIQAMRTLNPFVFIVQDQGIGSRSPSGRYGAYHFERYDQHFRSNHPKRHFEEATEIGIFREVMAAWAGKHSVQPQTGSDWNNGEASDSSLHQHQVQSARDSAYLEVPTKPLHSLSRTQT